MSAPVETIAISGGAGRHPLIRQLLADAAGLPLLSTRSEEPVLLGSAILGAMAAGEFATMDEAMAQMSSIERTYEPASGALRDWHERRYRLYGKFQEVAREAAAK